MLLMACVHVHSKRSALSSDLLPNLQQGESLVIFQNIGGTYSISKKKVFISYR